MRVDVDLKNDEIILKVKENHHDNPEVYEMEQEAFQEDAFVAEQEDDGNADVPQKELRKKKKKALLEFRCKMEDAILGDYLLGESNYSSPQDLSKAKEELRNISLWGVPLLPSRAHEGTDMVLLKFLKAKDYKVSDAFEMLQRTLLWRRKFRADEVLHEKMNSDLENVMQMTGKDKQGRPVCYNAFGVLRDKRTYGPEFDTDEKCEDFLRRRIQCVEMDIQKLIFKPGGPDKIVQVMDLKNLPGQGTKRLLINKKLNILLQDHYPEIIHRNIIINAPFWYYASHACMAKFLTQRFKSKFIFARSGRATETLLKYITPENLPFQYGGLMRDNDQEFSSADNVLELSIKVNGSNRIQIPIANEGVTVVWDAMVVGKEVTYKEEFIPDDEGSYKILIQKEKKLGQGIRNSFYINEPGKIVVTINNSTLKKKKVFYRFKSKPTVPVYILCK
ncbi:CRAL-TRIO lipid binding domain [Dillenia turbinata]|uniref:CRAL-TRIO lipid binding domain n=1 Tax=Dillenia turbinata TaxID=194707 RepID=A0AAN8W3E4_9MAGN